MEPLLLAAVAALGFANGANDNFKGVATLWGAGRASYCGARGWATVTTLLGSLAALWLAQGLVAKFNGSKLLVLDTASQVPFAAAVALGTALTILLASRVGMPVSTTHALTGGLAGAGLTAAGFAGVEFAALGPGVFLPLLFSPLVAMVLTMSVYPAAVRLVRGRDCVCVDAHAAAEVSALGMTAATAVAPPLRWASMKDCHTGAEAVRWDLSNALHWISAAGISFARGLNDTPKIAALLLSAAFPTQTSFALVAVVMAVGGLLGTARVAHTMSKQITPMASEEAVGANLAAAGLVTLASLWALPVSTTHVTSGGIFGIALLRRREADWRLMRMILLSWLVTLPAGALLASVVYMLFTR
jgi:PiT family inorganic phosphate transporter